MKNVEIQSAIFGIIKQYGELLRMHGDDSPIFCMSGTCKRIVCSTENKEISSDDYISYADLTEDEKLIRGVFGKYYGVLLVAVII